MSGLRMRSGGTTMMGKRGRCAKNTPIVTSERESGPPSRPLPSDMIRRLFLGASDQVICQKRKGRSPWRPPDGLRSRSRLSQLVGKRHFHGAFARTCSPPISPTAGPIAGTSDAVDSGTAVGANGQGPISRNVVPGNAAETWHLPETAKDKKRIIPARDGRALRLCSRESECNSPQV